MSKQIIEINDVVQFNEWHKWCASIGIVTDVNGDWYHVGIPMPKQGAESRETIYIRCHKSEMEYIGRAKLVEERNTAACRSL